MRYLNFKATDQKLSQKVTDKGTIQLQQHSGHIQAVSVQVSAKNNYLPIKPVQCDVFMASMHRTHCKLYIANSFFCRTFDDEIILRFFLDQEILVFNLENESVVKRQQIRTTRILNYTLFIDKCANISN